jgi:hypothetical protein
MSTKPGLVEYWIREAYEYASTADFRHGVTVELAGMMVDISLLIILVPSLLWIFNLPRRRRNKAMASFFTIQFVRDMANLLLQCGGAADTQALLNGALSANKLQGLSSHPFYGNTDDLFGLLQLRMNGGEHVEGYKHLSDTDLDQLLFSSQDMLNRLDQYIFLFSSLDLTEYSEQYFQARMFVFPMRDHFLSLRQSKSRDLTDTDEIKSLSTGAAAYFHHWFSVERVRPDRTIKFRLIRQTIQAYSLFPFLIAYRLVARFICRTLKVPFSDPVGSNFFQSMLTAICSAPDADLKLISEKTNTSVDLLVSYCMGHRMPSREEELRILLAIRPLVDVTVWCHMVIETINHDLRGRRLKLVLSDALHANGAWWLMMLTNGMTPKGVDMGTALMKVVLRR